MFAYAAIPLTCWLCTLIATPHAPRLGDTVADLVYSRLLGRQQALRFLAIILTVGALLAGIVTMPQQENSDLHAQRRVTEYCNLTAVHAPVCTLLQPDGMWLEAQRRGDGTWQIIATLRTPWTEDEQYPTGYSGG